MSIAQSLLPEFDHELATTREMLAAVPEGKNDGRPHPKSMTLGRLAGHVAELQRREGPRGDREGLRR